MTAIADRDIAGLIQQGFAYAAVFAALTFIAVITATR